MAEVSTIGLDIAKSVFQIHGVDVEGAVVIRKRVNRAKVLEFFAALPSCLVGIEACPTAHHWSRRLQALGHMVRLMPPSSDSCESLCLHVVQLDACVENSHRGFRPRSSRSRSERPEVLATQTT